MAPLRPVHEADRTTRQSFSAVAGGENERNALLHELVGDRICRLAVHVDVDHGRVEAAFGK